MDDADDVDIIVGDALRADPPGCLASLGLHPRCLLCARKSVESSVFESPNRTHVDEPADGTRNAAREFLDGHRVERWLGGLLPSHNLAAPFAIPGPLPKENLRQRTTARWAVSRTLIRMKVVEHSMTGVGVPTPRSAMFSCTAKPTIGRPSVTRSF